MGKININTEHLKSGYQKYTHFLRAGIDAYYLKSLCIQKFSCLWDF